MTDITTLWLPIVGASVLVFIASSLIHMVLPWHKGDYPKLPNEDAVLDALRPLNLVEGDFMAPRCDNMKEYKSPEFAARLKAGPVVMLTVLPNGPVSMGRNLGMWFVYCVVVSLFAAYLSAHAVAPGAATAAEVWRFSGVTAFVGYTLALYQMSIWYRRSWRVTLFRRLMD